MKNVMVQIIITIIKIKKKNKKNWDVNVDNIKSNIK